jgi:hypothetical protein
MQCKTADMHNGGRLPALLIEPLVNTAGFI